MRRANTNFEGCCDGLDPMMIQEVQHLVSNFESSWGAIMNKYNVKPISEFTNTLDTISEAISKVKELLNGLNTDASKSDFRPPALILQDPSISIETDKPESDAPPTDEPETDEPETDKPNTDSDLDSDPVMPDLDSSEKDYKDDFAVIDDYERAIFELNEKIKNLAKDFES